MFRSLFVTAWHWRRADANFLAGLILFGACAIASGYAAAENIKVGVVRATNGAPVFIAQEQGYFAAEGVPVELVYFESGQPIAVATVAGSIDFGVTGPTGGLYSLAGQGALRIIAAGIREAPGFHYFAYLVSGRAYEAGLKTPQELAGHSVAITQIGSPQHYMLGLLADKYGFDLKSFKLLPLQSIANDVSAVVGGQADATVLGMVSAVVPMVQKGDIRVLGWVGDETPWQVAIAFTATKTGDQRSNTVARFLRAYRKGVRDYHDAFVGPGETSHLEPTANAVWATIAKYTGNTIEELKLGVPYVDPDARLDVKNILHQIAWYKSQGMVKGDVDGDQVIDKRYVVPLPEH
jgi:NitT/TauT family transport system substrate-binding protein